MKEEEAKNFCKNILNLSASTIDKLELFKKLLLDYNNKYNLISRNTEKLMWSRHIADSAQLLRFIDTKLKVNIADLGTGAGFPGIVIAICNRNPDFHVKLYEKSSVKRDFLKQVKKKLDIKFDLEVNVLDQPIEADIIVSRAFKKLEKIIKISREMIKKPHKIIILKGKNAQEEINNVSLGANYSYKLENSLTNADSRIIIVNVK